jgi:hypothetical protein
MKQVLKTIRTLADLPLWRLLVFLDDAEREAGPDSQTARTLARVIQEKLRGQPRPEEKESH